MGYFYRLDCRRFNLRMIFEYLVYRLQSTAGFEFVAENGLHWATGCGMCRWAFSMITVSETLRRLLQRI